MAKKEFLAEYSTRELPTNSTVHGSKNTYSRIMRISHSLLDFDSWRKDRGRDNFKDWISRNRQYNSFIEVVNENYLDKFGLRTFQPDTRQLISYSFFLQFKFTLAKPYISRDDEVFYIIENPVKKDKVFRVPLMSPSGWKGNLRWAAGRNFVDNLPAKLDEIFVKRLVLIRIFGNETEAINQYFNGCISQKLFNKKEKKEIEEIGKQFQQYLERAISSMKDVAGLQGRLYFYPTFFNKIDLEVINPHDRKTRTGTVPIYFEVVPATATGTFSLFWFPFNLVENTAELEQALQQDWAIIKDALKKMFLTYGFSAKKTSGFGVIENSICDKRFMIAGTEVNLMESEASGLSDFFQKIDAEIARVLNE